MAPGGAHGGHGDVDALITERRLQLAGKPGIAGLLANGKTFSIAVFASLGSVCDLFSPFAMFITFVVN